MDEIDPDERARLLEELAQLRRISELGISSAAAVAALVADGGQDEDEDALSDGNQYMDDADLDDEDLDLGEDLVRGYVELMCCRPESPEFLILPTCGGSSHCL